MNFLGGVNRVLRSNGILRGDDDDLTSFSQTQHSATMALAQIAIQDQLSSLVSDNFIPFEEASFDITCVSGQRLYDLPADFIRFQDEPDRLALWRVGSGSTPDGTFVMFKDELDLRASFADYRERRGQPIWFYLPNTQTGKIGLFNVPDSVIAGDIYRGYYEKDVSVNDEGDTLPFRTEFTANIFCRMASRHFGIMFQMTGKPTGLDPQAIEQDPVLIALRAQLIEAMKPTRNNSKWIR